MSEAKLRLLISKINKKFGENTIGTIADINLPAQERLSSGSLFLDWALGQNEKGEAGWALGRLVELYGLPSTGKSLISMKTIAEAQKRNMVCAYIDCENAFDPEFATKLGVDVDKLIISQATIGEVAIEVVSALLKEKGVDVVIFDSVASMIPKKELEDDMEQQQMALPARMMSKGLRKLVTLNEGKALIIFINQIRHNPGAYGNPEYTPGGKSLGFYSSIRVEIKGGEWILEEKTKDKIGQEIRFKIVKNKTSTPYREGYFRFLYTGEIDKIDELISLGLLRRRIEQRGSYFYIGESGFHGREELETALKEDEKLFEETRKLVFNV